MGNQRTAKSIQKSKREKKHKVIPKTLKQQEGKTMNEQVNKLIVELRMNQIVFVTNELREEFNKEVSRRELIVFGGMMTERGQYAYID